MLYAPLVRYELWYSDSERTLSLLHEADASFRHFRAGDARVIWSIEADSYQEAAQKRDEFLTAAQREGTIVVDRDMATTRFTQAAYLDADGQQQSLVAPGWVGMVQPLIDANISATAILGQLYFERPGRDAPLDMAGFLKQVRAHREREITIVDLRSAEGEQRMCQEFYGRMEDPERIRYMVWRRLGSEMSNWRLVESFVLQVPDAHVDSNGQPTQPGAQYSDCKMFVSPTGLAGFALGTTGKRAGTVYDFFVSPREKGLGGCHLMNLAIEQGALMLVICDDAVIGRFFEQFGFQATAKVAASGAPANWVRDVCGPRASRITCPDFVYMAKVGKIRPELASLLARPPIALDPSDTFDARTGPCANCGSTVADDRRFSHFNFYGGYDCKRCGYLHICGTLTMGAPEGA